MVAAIFAAVKNEDQRSELEQFYLEYRDRLLRLAFSKVNDRCDAEDAVQKIFAYIADKPEKFFDLSPNDRPAYVGGMIKNISTKMFKAKSKVHIEELDEEIEDTGLSVESNVLGRISRDELLEFIQRLPAKQKDVLTLRCFSCLSLYEIAQKLNISMPTVSKRLEAAREAIRKFIDERNADHE